MLEPSIARHDCRRLSNDHHGCMHKVDVDVAVCTFLCWTRSDNGRPASSSQIWCINGESANINSNIHFTHASVAVGLCLEVSCELSADLFSVLAKVISGASILHTRFANIQHPAAICAARFALQTAVPSAICALAGTASQSTADISSCHNHGCI